jgi:hypothetical protein
MKTTFKLSTVDLQVNAENQYGIMNSMKTSMTWKNLNFSQIFGDKLYNDSNYFSMKLLNVINNTGLLYDNDVASLALYYFTFEDIQLGNVMNEGDYLNYGNGTIIGDCNIVASNKVNGGFSALFNQTGLGKITFPDYAITTTNGGYTVCFWYNMTTVAYEQTFFYSNYIYFLKLGTTFRYKINNVVANTPVYTFTANTWVHISITHATDGTLNVYVNNVLFHTANIAYPANNTLNIGNSIASVDVDSKKFVGYMDDFRIYDKVISTTERGLIYTQNYPVEPTYLNINSFYQIKASGLPFLNRGYGKSSLALTQMIQTNINIISNNEIVFQKPSEVGNLNLDFIDISTNAIGNKYLSDSVFVFQIEGLGK